MTQPLWPCTIVADRYSGAYSGAAWTAFHMEGQVPVEVSSDDCTCAEFWDLSASLYLIGKGSTPQEAYDDLVVKVREYDETLDKRNVTCHTSSVVKSTDLKR
jgi:hypothetical protein